MADKDNPAPLLSITGDTANRVLPFRAPAQNKFSFRKLVDKIGDGGINICPSSMRNAITGGFQEDTSIRAIAPIGGLEDILADIPAVQIREYAQDARIVQIQNAFAAFKNGWDAFKNRKDDGGLWEQIQKLFEKLPDTIRDKFAKFSAFPAGVSGSIFMNGDAGQDIKKFVLDIPFILYYEIMSSKTTGYYTLPYSGKLVDSSNGQVGWNTQHGFAGWNTSQHSLLGAAINFFGKNIKFNTTPTWDGNTNNDYPAMEVQFDLFNDTLESSINNFLFLNQIMPKNRFMQYHIFQHNPCIYDVKIEGYGRFYMCSGQITCDYKGASRRPSDKFFNELANMVSDGFKPYLTEETLKSQKLVRIPDVYSFKLNLTSLLPNSLNNYLFQYSGNKNVDDGELESFGTKDYPKEIKGAMNEAMEEATADSPEIKSALTQSNG